MRKKIVVLISGSGTNLQAIIDACKCQQINADVVAVISNNDNAFGLQRAQQHDIPAICLSHTHFASRELFDQALAEAIHAYSPDLVVLAGFMRILSADFVAQFTGRMFNIHPSLLPKYPGLNTHKRAIENRDKEHGVSVHFVTAELDGGPVVLQSKVDINELDTPDTLAKKVAHQEWLIYPLVIAWFCNDRLHLQNDQVWLDKKRIKKQGILYEEMGSKQLNDT